MCAVWLRFVRPGSFSPTFGVVFYIFRACVRPVSSPAYLIRIHRTRMKTQNHVSAACWQRWFAARTCLRSLCCTFMSEERIKHQPGDPPAQISSRGHESFFVGVGRNSSACVVRWGLELNFARVALMSTLIRTGSTGQVGGGYGDKDGGSFDSCWVSVGCVDWIRDQNYVSRRIN